MKNYLSVNLLSDGPLCYLNSLWKAIDSKKDRLWDTLRVDINVHVETKQKGAKQLTNKQGGKIDDQIV